MSNQISSEELERKKQEFSNYHLQQYRNIRDLEINAQDQHKTDSYRGYEWEEGSGVTPRNPPIKTRLVRSKDSIINDAKENYGHRLEKYSSFLTIGLDKIASVCSANNISMATIIGVPTTIIASLATGNSSFITLGVSALVTMGALNIVSSKVSGHIVDKNINRIVTDMTEKYAAEIKSDFNHETFGTDITNAKPSDNNNKELTSIPSIQSIKDKVISLRTSTENLHIKPLPTV